MAIRKKTASKKKAVARRGSTAVGKSMEDWRKELQQTANEEAAKEVVPEGSNISWSQSGGPFVYKGEDIGDELNVIIVDTTYMNSWYDRPYNKDNPSPPACIAIGDDQNELVPFENCPNLQAETCEDCWANEWGSGTGDGKACKNQRRLAVIDPECEEELAFLNLAPTTMKNYARYVKDLNRKHKLPSFAVVTTIAFDEDVDYAKLTFDISATVESAEIMQKIMELRESNREAMREAPDFSNYEAPTTKGRISKKKSARRR